MKQQSGMLHCNQDKSMELCLLRDSWSAIREPPLNTDDIGKIQYTVKEEFLLNLIFLY